MAGRRGSEPSSVTKMAIGCMLLGCSFVVMIFAARASGGQQSVSIWWLYSCMVILTIGELYLSPVGLSLVTKLAPGPHGLDAHGHVVSVKLRG